MAAAKTKPEISLKVFIQKFDDLVKCFLNFYILQAGTVKNMPPVGINPVASKITQSRGGVTFTKLEGGTYYISVRSADINADRKVTI